MFVNLFTITFMDLIHNYDWKSAYLDIDIFRYNNMASAFNSKIAAQEKMFLDSLSRVIER